MLVVYQSSQGRYYIEQTPVAGEGNLFVGFKPLDEHFIKTVFRSMDIREEATLFSGYVPDNVIGYAHGFRNSTVMWYTPPFRPMMIFNKETRIKSQHYSVPGLLWIYNGSLDIYAYKKWNAKETELYMPPFYNCDKNGNVCLGTASQWIAGKKAMSFEDLMKTVQDGFWKSEFTHGTHVTIKGSFAELYQITAKEHFPLDVLKPVNKTVKQLCDALFKKST
jgi:PRTRC genetic system protein B